MQYMLQACELHQLPQAGSLLFQELVRLACAAQSAKALSICSVLRQTARARREAGKWKTSVRPELHTARLAE
jgi:hypothetical protein